MIPYKVFPMFELGPLHFNMYGIMFALGVLITITFAARIAVKRGFNKKNIEDLSLYMLLGAIIGARLFYVLFYWSGGPLTFLSAIAVWEGGLSWFGGFTGALAVIYFYSRISKLKFFQIADIFTLPLIIGHIFGRIGGYLTGQHPGKITDLPWAIYLDNALRHPVVLYELIGLGIIVVILLNLKKFKLFDVYKVRNTLYAQENLKINFLDGFLFLSYVMLYSIQRMILDFFRIESADPRYFGLTPSQYIVIVLFIIAAYFMIVKFNETRR